MNSRFARTTFWILRRIAHGLLSGEVASQPASPNRTHDVTLSLDATLELLADAERRAMLDYLVDASDQTATVHSLVENLVERHIAVTGERPGHDQLELRLYHVQLPKLADAGFIDYDARSEELCYWSNERLETWLERIRAEEPS